MVGHFMFGLPCQLLFDSSSRNPCERLPIRRFTHNVHFWPNADKRDPIVPTIMRYHTHQEVYMRTNIVIDDQLVADAMKLSGVKTKREVVELALRRLVSSAKQKDILDLVGQDMIAPGYDVRAVRARMGTRRGPG